MKKLLLILIISSHALADDAVYLEKGQAAPFQGYLISEEKAEKIRLMDIDLKLQNRANELLTQENTLLRENINYSREHVKDLNKQLVESRSSFFGKFGVFLLGAATATLITYGTARALR